MVVCYLLFVSSVSAFMFVLFGCCCLLLVATTHPQSVVYCSGFCSYNVIVCVCTAHIYYINIYKHFIFGFHHRNDGIFTEILSADLKLSIRPPPPHIESCTHNTSVPLFMEWKLYGKASHRCSAHYK